jgi:hypothetical protein
MQNEGNFSPRRKIFLLKSENFRLRKFTFILPQANYHSAFGGLSFCEADYHSRKARLTPFTSSNLFPITSAHILSAAVGSRESV